MKQRENQKNWFSLCFCGGRMKTGYLAIIIGIWYNSATNHFKGGIYLSSDPIWGQLILQVVLILLNAFFASTEIAVLSLNENLIRRKAEDGDKKAKQMLRIIQTPTAFLSTIQIGITLAGFLGSAFAADNFASRITDYFVNVKQVTTLSPGLINTLSVIIITLILSYFTLVLGELVPKRIAMQKPEKVARMSCGVVTVLSKIMRPVIWLLSVSTNGMLRLFGIDPNKEEEPVSEDEIRMMVDIGEEKGAIEANEKEMIENIFEFNNISAGDIMVHRTDMEIIWLDDTPEQIIQTIQETGLSRFPVCGEDADDVAGLLFTREYLLNARSKVPKPLAEILRPAYFVPETVRADVLFRNMQNKKMHMALVVDEYGGICGLITMEDLLERIVGDIYDESDLQEEQDIVQLEDNLWKIQGSTRLEEISEALDVEIPQEEEYDTLGGLVMETLDVIPEDGTRLSVEAFGLKIDVQQIQDRRIEWALVSKIQKEETEDEKENR